MCFTQIGQESSRGQPTIGLERRGEDRIAQSHRGPSTLLATLGRRIRDATTQVGKYFLEVVFLAVLGQVVVGPVLPVGRAFDLGSRLSTLRRDRDRPGTVVLLFQPQLNGQDVFAG